MDILVINLERRPDRLAAVSDEAALLGLRFTVVQAVDGGDPEASIDARFIERGQSAVWSSHVRAFRLAEARKSPYVLVLEDDATFEPVVAWRSFLDDLEAELSRRDVDLFQLGFIDPYARGIRPRLARLARRVARSQKRATWLVGTQRLDVVPFSFLAGTHAYVVSHRLAGLLTEINDPPWIAADGALDRFTRTQAFARRFTCARSATSMVNQRSRTPGYRGPVDSDNAAEGTG